MAFQIPKEGRRALAELLKAPPAFLDAFYNALKDCEPRLLTRDTAKLRDKLGTFAETYAKSLSGFLRLINGMLSASDDISTDDEIVAEVVAAAQATGESALGSTAAGWANVKTFLRKALALETVRVSGRAQSLLYDVPRHMHDVRILTDARPVFVKRAEESPSAFVIIHTMRLDYYEDGQNKDWYLALDFKDLQDLKKAIDRAIEKQSSLQRILKKTDSVVLVSSEVSE